MDEQRYRELIDRGGDLKISVSGIRGRIPQGLDPENMLAFLRAFCAITGRKIVIGNDARPTAPILRHLAIGTMLAAGKEIFDIGLAPTPTVKAAVRQQRAGGGIMFSASHNPEEWNAFKFIKQGGLFFDAVMSEKLLRTLRRGDFPARDYRGMGRLQTLDGIGAHIKEVHALVSNRAAIRKRRFRIVVDAVGGAGREALPRLLEELGCRVSRLHCDPVPGGKFPRPPEPTPRALREFGRRVQKEQSDIGFALDPDADRLVIASPGRGAIAEEYTLPLALMGTRHYRPGGAKKSSRPGIVVVNLSTATIIDEVARRGGMRVIRSAVGEANVVELMLKRKAIFGGEGNGGVIHPEVSSFGRDSLVGAALILSALAANNCGIDELMDSLPPLYMNKIRIPVADRPVPEIFRALEKTFPDSRIDDRDGRHLTLSDGSWLHVRESNTEPIIRVIFQAPTVNRERELKRILAAL